jgi:hypothetical protein
LNNTADDELWGYFGQHLMIIMVSEVDIMISGVFLRN